MKWIDYVSTMLHFPIEHLLAHHFKSKYWLPCTQIELDAKEFTRAVNRAKMILKYDCVQLWRKLSSETNIIQKDVDFIVHKVEKQPCTDQRKALVQIALYASCKKFRATSQSTWNHFEKSRNVIEELREVIRTGEIPSSGGITINEDKEGQERNRNSNFEDISEAPATTINVLHHEGHQEQETTTTSDVLHETNSSLQDINRGGKFMSRKQEREVLQNSNEDISEASATMDNVQDIRRHWKFISRKRSVVSNENDVKKHRRLSHSFFYCRAREVEVIQVCKNMECSICSKLRSYLESCMNNCIATSLSDMVLS
jgi:hypothetical protein